ncbi:hypothetical protein EG327_004358 [Venturia inaequalis]|uniref:Uncharacterized protein n=1 Tax=Venturia inaequalis TaxID=5025 RepID=A0A8H3VQM9_VENIN|nr:hypothetical protein EG327_004358 [Venturia inaequalis]
MTDSSTTKKPSSGHSSDWNKWEFPAVPAPSAEDARSSCDEEMHDVDVSFHIVPNRKDSMKKLLLLLKKPNGKSLETVYWTRDLQNLRQARKYRFKRRGSKTWYLWGWSTFDGHFANMEGKILPATAHHDNRYSCQPWHPYHYIGGDNALKTPLHTRKTPAVLLVVVEARSGQSRPGRKLRRRRPNTEIATKAYDDSARKDLTLQSRKATEQDARRTGIPIGFSTKDWDPTEEPITLLGSVFDANSLGKWIYDWTVLHHSPATPVSDIAGDLWLLLIQLAGRQRYEPLLMSTNS